MRPALYVEVDCDLYVSTRQALEWMIESGLIVNGTLIGYDDWFAGGRAGGEALAHKEVVAKYKLKLKALSPQIYLVRHVARFPVSEVGRSRSKQRLAS